ncbi:MAG: hypothetical protein GY861_25865 [bacterium]|nr:hypothetical protein [bacterium]
MKLDLETGVSWINTPLQPRVQTMKNIDSYEHYRQFIKDLMKTSCCSQLDCSKWSFEEFKQKGYVRASLTQRKGCYVKRHKNFIAKLFGKDEILFSFDK